MNTALLIGAILTGLGGLIGSIAALRKSRTDAVATVAQAAVELLGPAREQVRFLSTELDSALRKVAALQSRVDELEAQLREKK